MCVQNDERNDGIVLGYVCWGARDPPTGGPNPPKDPHPLKGWGRDLSLNAPRALGAYGAVLPCPKPPHCLICQQRSPVSSLGGLER